MGLNFLFVRVQTPHDLSGQGNSFEYLEYLKRGRIAKYVAAKGITHVLERGPYHGWVVPIRRVLQEIPLLTSTNRRGRHLRDRSHSARQRPLGRQVSCIDLSNG